MLLSHIDAQPASARSVAAHPSGHSCEQGTQTDAPAAPALLKPPPLASGAAVPPPPPPPPLPMLAAASSAALPVARPTAQQLLGGLAGLRKAVSVDEGARDGGRTIGLKKRASDLAGARPAGGFAVSIEDLEGVKLRAAPSRTDAEPPPQHCTPEMIKARTRLRAVQHEERPATPLGASAPQSRGVHRGEGEEAVHGVSARVPSQYQKARACAPEVAPVRVRNDGAARGPLGPLFGGWLNRLS